LEEQSQKRGIPPGVTVAVCILCFYLVLKFLVNPPLPSSLIFMYMALCTVGATVYLNLFHDIGKSVVGPVLSFWGGGMEGGLARVGRYIVLIGLPILVWCNLYNRLGSGLAAPLEQRVIHPAPPGDVMGLYNPFRKEEEGEEVSEELRAHLDEGREIYFKNCVFCHGDMLDGKGLFAQGLNPQPANFQDPGTIAMLQESYLFWRVSTGGIGLPLESTPWNSAMPRWETMLTEEERWKVIMFLYDYTGRAPRTWE
jgi:mono/diheme cytochrome c family protein